MKNAIIVHGMPSKEEYYSGDYPSASNSHWLPWLQKQLIMRNVKADTPEMPFAYEPDYVIWKSEFERFDITPETILVGHSCGAGFLMRWLSEHKSIRVGKVVLIAPWLDTEGELKTGFFNFTIDEELVLRTQGVTIFMSDDDSSDIHSSVEKIEAELKDVAVVPFIGYGHFTGESHPANVFPELLELVIK